MESLVSKAREIVWVVIGIGLGAVLGGLIGLIAASLMPTPPVLEVASVVTETRFKLVLSEKLPEPYRMSYIYVSVIRDQDLGKSYLITRSGHGLAMVEMKP